MFGLKVITIAVVWPLAIEACDSDGQKIKIDRIVSDDSKEEISDNDICTVWSRVEGDEYHGKVGNCQWHEAFATIQTIFNSTSCD